MITLKPLTKPVVKEILVPGSKSYTNRALLMGVLVNHPVKLNHYLISDDTLAMIDCLKKLGIKVEEKNSELIVKGSYKDIADGLYLLDADLSGTALRFLLAFCCVVPGTKIIGGKMPLNRRPVAELVYGLRQLGAKIDYKDKEGFPPVVIKSTKLYPGVAKIRGDVSSQYFSAILMVSPMIGEVEIEVKGEQVSKPYIDMTIDTMEKFGVKVINENYQRYIVHNGTNYDINEYTVEGDFSSAGYFFALAALTKSTITLKNLNPDSKQADLQFVRILEKMGNIIKSDKDSMTITGSSVKPVKVNMEDCPDQAQTLAVLASFARGKTTISGIKSLRIKETDRISALENELKKMGIKTELTGDSLVIFGGEPKPAIIDTYDDHRMAMSFAVAGAKIDGMKINNPEVVSKSFPDFWEKLKLIGVGVEEG